MSENARPVLFSVVVPTRNRADTLQHCLRTCLDQDFDDYEIVVSDNCSVDDTRDVVASFGSDRIRYFRTETSLAMSANWEFGLSKTSGQYVTFIGDDDGLMPYALRELSRLVARYDEPKAIHWTPAYYYWPNIAAKGAANYMILPLTRSINRYQGRERLKQFARRELDWSLLPTLYNSVIHRSLIDRHIATVGRMFVTTCPDVYSAYAFGYLCDDYLSSSVPMHINGASASSNGVSSAIQLDQAQSVPDKSLKIAEEFKSLNTGAGYLRHPSVPDCEILQTHYDNSFQHAKDLLFPADDDIAIDRKAMVRGYLDGILSSEPATVDAIKEAVRRSLADRPDLLPWFEEEAAKPRAAAVAVNPIHKPERLGFDGRFLLLDTKPLPVTTIAEAVRFADNILQIGSQPIRYDLECVADVAARATVIEHELVDRTRRLEEAIALMVERTEQAQALSDLVIERTRRAEELAALVAEQAALVVQLKAEAAARR
jgi:glycosyltransferase involved in cell wall biosynthesis